MPSRSLPPSLKGKGRSRPRFHGPASGVSGNIVGTNNTLNEGGNSTYFNVRNTGAGTNAVNFGGLNDYAGLLGGSGYVVTGADGTVNTWANTSFSVTGDSNTVQAADGDNVALVGSSSTINTGAGVSGNIVGANDTLNEGGNSTYFNVRNTGPGADVVNFGALNDYAGLLGGTGYLVNGADGTVNTWANTSFTVLGDRNTVHAADGDIVGLIGSSSTINAGAGVVGNIVGTDNVLNEGGDSTHFNVRNTGAGADTINFGAINDSAGLLGGAGYAVNGSNGAIVTSEQTTFSAFGDNDGITLAKGDRATIAGAAIVVANVGAGTRLDLVANTSASVFGSGGTVGIDGAGVQLTASAQTILTVDRASLALTGSNNGISLGLNNILSITSGSGNFVHGDATSAVNLASNTSTTIDASGGSIGIFGTGVQVTASGETVRTIGNTSLNLSGSNDLVASNAGDEVSVTGENNTITGASNELIYVAGTNGSGDTIAITGATIGATDALGHAAGVYLAANAQASVFGSSDLIYVSAGGTLAAVGGDNQVVAEAGTSVLVGGTNGATDVIHASGNQAGSTTADGRSTGLFIADNTQASIIGNGNTAFIVGQNSAVGTLGDGNAVLAGINDTVAIKGNGNAYSSAAGGSVLFAGVGNTAAVNDTAVYLTDGNSVAVSGTPSNAADLAAALAGSLQVAADIDYLYKEVLARNVDPTGLADAQKYLGAGNTFTGLRAKLAGFAELADDLRVTYAAIGADAPSTPEIDGFSAVMAASYNAPIQVISHEGQVVANTSAVNLLAELPVLETLDNGRTLSLSLPGGMNLFFKDTAHLADFLYAVAVQKSQADPVVTFNYTQDMTWLNQIDQPILEHVGQFQELAAFNTAQGKTDQATLAGVAARIALRIAAQDSDSHYPISERISLRGHQTDVTVFADSGSATYHDVDPGIGAILETVGIGILDIAAFAFPETGLPILAATVNAGEAGNAFYNGDVIGGLLKSADAAGGFSIVFGKAASLGSLVTASTVLKIASQGVGGIYGAVSAAESGDALGALAGSLEAIAAAVGICKFLPDNGPTGLGANVAGPPLPPTDFDKFASQVIGVINEANIAIPLAQSFLSGNIAGGLVSSFGTFFSERQSFVETYAALGSASDISIFDGSGRTTYSGVDGTDGGPAAALTRFQDPATALNQERQIREAEQQSQGDSADFDPVAVQAKLDPNDLNPLPNLRGYLTGSASSPFAHAFLIPSDPQSHTNPTYVTDNDGTVVYDGAGIKLLAPEALPPQFFADRGLTDGATGIYGLPIIQFAIQDAYGGSSVARFSIEAQLYALSPLQFFGIGVDSLRPVGGVGPWDVQRPTPGPFHEEFTPYASFVLGVYAAASGIPESMAQRINDDTFAVKTTLFGALPPQQIGVPGYSHTPTVNYINIDLGYKWFHANYP